MRRILLLSFLFFLTCAAVQVQAETSEITCQIGICSVWKPGVWTPLVVQANSGATPIIALEAADDDGNWVRYPVSEGKTLFRASRQSKTIRLISSEKTIEMQLPPPTGSYQNVFLVIGSEEEAELVRRAVIHSNEDKTHKPVIVQLNSTDKIPECGLNSLQVINRVVWFHKPGQKIDSFALINWLNQGGDVTISTLDAQLNFACFLPNNKNADIPPVGQPENNSSDLRLPHTRVLEDYINSDVPIPQLGQGRKYFLPVVRFPETPNTVIECRFMDIPLVFRQAAGFGRLTIAAFDLNAPQFKTWSNREKFVRRILDIPEEIKETERFTANAILHYGYDDLSGQLASALDKYANIPSISFWLIAGALILFIALIGPGDYFLWRKLNLPTWLTWISFPLYIALFCGLFYSMTLSKSSSIRANWAAIRDFDCVSGQTQTFFYGDIYVPQANRFDIEFHCRNESSGSNQIPASGWTNWFGSTGQGISGMNSATQLVSMGQNCYFADNQGGIESIPLAAKAPRNLAGSQFYSVNYKNDSDKSFNMEFHLKDDLGKPIGTITNKGAAALEECLLLYGQWAFPIGEIKPNETISVDDTFQRYSLDAVLVGKRVTLSDVSVKYSNDPIPYNPTELNPIDILRAMMFYQASGGAGYTKLDNGYQAPTDFSSLIKLNRAVLLCKIPSEQANKEAGLYVRQSESEQTKTKVNLTPVSPMPGDWRLLFYRFVIPLEQSPTK